MTTLINYGSNLVQLYNAGYKFTTGENSVADLTKYKLNLSPRFSKLGSVSSYLDIKQQHKLFGDIFYE